jgi:5'-methylthioadenosine nucleosidase
MRLAMQAEAMPLVQTLNLSEQDEPSIFPKALPWKKYSGTHEGLTVHVVVPGKDLKLGVDSVGTVPVSMLTYASIVSLHPDLIINAGTAGGFRVCTHYYHDQA